MESVKGQPSGQIGRKVSDQCSDVSTGTHAPIISMFGPIYKPTHVLILNIPFGIFAYLFYGITIMFKCNSPYFCFIIFLSVHRD